jgi:hypothetical protein
MGKECLKKQGVKCLTVTRCLFSNQNCKIVKSILPVKKMSNLGKMGHLSIIHSTLASRYYYVLIVEISYSSKFLPCVVKAKLLSIM